MSAEMLAFLKTAVRDFAIDPYDARSIITESDDDPDWGTFGDYLDGAGYPELAERAYDKVGL